MKTRLIVTLLTMIVAGCSTYKARDEGFGKMGYEEKQLANGTYMLSYYGSSYDDKDDVMEKWNRRAAELCGKRDYQSKVSTREWTYDGYTILPPLIFKSKGASPLVEGKLTCKK